MFKVVGRLNLALVLPRNNVATLTRCSNTVQYSCSKLVFVKNGALVILLVLAYGVIGGAMRFHW